MGSELFCAVARSDDDELRPFQHHYSELRTLEGGAPGFRPPLSPLQAFRAAPLPARNSEVMAHHRATTVPELGLPESVSPRATPRRPTNTAAQVAYIRRIVAAAEGVVGANRQLPSRDVLRNALAPAAAGTARMESTSLVFPLLYTIAGRDDALSHQTDPECTTDPS